MEVKVQVKQLKRLAQELETVAKQLASSIARLEKPHRHPDRPEIAKQLRTLGSSLKEQAETCKDMAAVLKPDSMKKHSEPSVWGVRRRLK